MERRLLQDDFTRITGSDTQSGSEALEATHAKHNVNLDIQGQITWVNRRLQSIG